ncbi:hypothetical protein PYW07_009529 [Mythimna separata]|uniref:THAP-type domain-containing protein n=1 Tax=Mythimna separata TaxID=271217 RepID=A0AAD8DMD4_MYTSE|nr:hypothetical protein PYW07_009529 [Mythimna separata]
MPVCSVMTCKYAQDDADPSSEGIVFHRFPKNEETRAKWIDMTGHEKWYPSPKDVTWICSRHFRETDYTVKRSGKKYLKTTAIPCEYVVYRHLYPDEEVPQVKVEPEETEPTEVEQPVVHEEQVPKVVVQHEPEYEMALEPQPGPSHRNNWFMPQTSRASTSQVLPDSTIFDNATFGRDTRAWQPERFFVHRVPAAIFDDGSRDSQADSSSFDDRYRRGEASANPFPASCDLNPHLQQLPLPRTPEPVNSMTEDDTTMGFGYTAPASPVTEIIRDHRTLQDIRQIMTKSRGSKKANAAARDEVLEAKKLEIKNTGNVWNSILKKYLLAILDYVSRIQHSFSKPSKEIDAIKQERTNCQRFHPLRIYYRVL